MGNKSDKKKENESLRKVRKSNVLLLPKSKNYTPAYSNFYYFTEWLTNFNFYTTIHTLYTQEDESSSDMFNIVIMKNGPNDFNVFKVIKAIDQLENKNFDDFNYLELMILNQDWDDLIQTSQVEESTDTDPETAAKVRNINLHNQELIEKFYVLLEDLYATKVKKYQKILVKGPPNNIRWMFWYTIAKIHYTNKENKETIEEDNDKIYRALLKKKIKKRRKNMIINDIVNSTHFPFKTKAQQDVLFNLVKAITLYYPSIEYKSELQTIIGYLLIVSDFNELQTFLFLRFLLSSSFGLKYRNFFIENNDNTKEIFSYTINELIKERFPKVDSLLNNIKCKTNWSAVFVKTLFTSNFPFAVCIRFWDCIIANGLSFLFNIILALIKYLQKDILECNVEDDFSSCFEINLQNEEAAISFREKIIEFALMFTLNNNLLSKLKSNFYSSHNSRSQIPSIANEEEKMIQYLLKIWNEEENELKDLDMSELDINSEHIPKQMYIEKPIQADNSIFLVSAIVKDETLSEVSIDEDNEKIYE